MTSKEALEEIKDWVEYFTRLDYVDPIVRGEVKQKFYDAYWGTTEHFKIIEKDLELLEQIEVKDAISDIIELDPYKKYLIRIDIGNLSIDEWIEFSKRVKQIFEDKGIDIIITPYNVEVEERAF